MKKGRNFLLFSALMTLLLCGALCFSVLHLYFTGLSQRALSGRVTDPVFTRDAVGLSLLRLLPVFILWLVSLILAALRGEKPRAAAVSLRRRVGTPMRGQEETPRRRSLRLALYLLALALVVLGVLNGGMHDVLVKAVQICTECIGLG